MKKEVESATSCMTKQEVWQSHMDQWKQSKLSQEKYCEQAGINYHTFVYWRGT